MPKRLTLTGKALRDKELYFRKEKERAKKRGDDITAGAMESAEGLYKHFKDKDVSADSLRSKKRK